MRLPAYLTITFASVMMIASCGNDQETSTQETLADHQDSTSVEVPVVETISLDSFFTAIDTSFTHNNVIVPEGFEVQILFSQGDMVITAEGVEAKAKGNHDMLAFIPDEINANKGTLFVSHETRDGNAILGDGGGATMFGVEKDETGHWKVTSAFEHVDFKGVGNTQRNCGGVVAPNGMIYSCEESEPQNNSALTLKGKGHTNIDSVNGLEYWQNFGYVVEIDPATRKATKKMIAMGRYYHEDLEFMEDNKTVYLSDDHEPAVFFKFVADTPGDYEFGQLYAYKEGADENAQGTWLPLARDTATMIRARDAAIELGATLYMRHEWFARIGNKLYIAETGHDETDWSNRIAQGGMISRGLIPHTEGTVVRDLHGRILVFDTDTDQMTNYLECGFAQDSATVISNPDCVSPARLGGKDYLIIHEDINKNTEGRVPAHAEKKGKYYTELYFLDLSIENPTPNDVKRFAIAPNAAEFTGGIMSPDGSTLFLNVQHPHSSNGEPYNKSMTLAITGWNKK